MSTPLSMYLPCPFATGAYGVSPLQISELSLSTLHFCMRDHFYLSHHHLGRLWGTGSYHLRSYLPKHTTISITSPHRHSIFSKVAPSRVLITGRKQVLGHFCCQSFKHIGRFSMCHNQKEAGPSQSYIPTSNISNIYFLILFLALVYFFFLQENCFHPL